MKRRICVVTGSRAEYGLLSSLMEELKKDPRVRLQVIATGMHLSKDFGMTYREIERDGFFIDKKINIALVSDTPVGISKSIAIAVRDFARVYKELKPDIVVLLGDRFEIFGAACAACISRIPIAHINGGEITEGAFDDALRHSITKMSQLHFTSAQEYRRRVIQLGEDPKRVFNTGALGVDNIRKLKPLSKKRLEKELKFKFNKRNLLVTFHPVTLENNTSAAQFKELLKAVDAVRNTNIIFTKANADTHGRIINKMIDDYVSKNRIKSIAFTSMGRLRYLSAMRYVDGVAGNSSSALIEAPSFNIGTINIGDRQKGRIRVKSIIDCKPQADDIKKALGILYSKRFQKQLKDVKSPYGDGNAAKKMKRILINYVIPDTLKKVFYGRG